MTTTFATAPLDTGHATVLAPSEAVAETGTGKPNYVSIYLSSIFAVTMVFLFGVGIPCWLFLDDALAGFGLGAMCAIWGGPSFGVMTGSARVSAFLEAQEHNH